jgi:site-specific recombinase XerD
MGNTVASRRDRSPAERRAAQHGWSLYARSGARKYVNADERARIIAVLERLEPGRALFVGTLLWTGARISEVLALTPASFQVASGIVALRTLKRRRFAVREVPMPTELMEALDAHFGLGRAQREEGASTSRLWAFCRVTAWRIVASVMAEAGVKGQPACPRGLRHGFGVGTLQAGVPVTLVQRWLGHARLSTTAIYAEVSGPEEQAFAERYWRSMPRRGGRLQRPR